MQKIIIIGAGPAGLLLAHYLLSRGDYRECSWKNCSKLMMTMY